jgi:hypothetical protein
LAILGVTRQTETASYGTNTLIGWICPSVYSRDLRIRGVRDGKLVVSRCALDKHFASISGRWPAPHVCEQEMLDDDSGFGEITVEICTRALHTVRLAKLRVWRDANSGSPRDKRDPAQREKRIRACIGGAHHPGAGAKGSRPGRRATTAGRSGASGEIPT